MIHKNLVAYNLSTCEICHKNRRKGNHASCSREKQRRAAASKKTNRVNSTKTYTNERILSSFIRTLE